MNTKVNKRFRLDNIIFAKTELVALAIIEVQSAGFCLPKGPVEEISLGRGIMTEPENKAKGKSRKMIDRTSTTSATGSKPPVYDIIGSRLRDYYDDVAKQPVPDRFMDLLIQLEAKTAKKD